jgi:hypothetical protein
MKDRQLTQKDFADHPILETIMVKIAQIETENPLKFINNYMTSVIYGDGKREKLLTHAFQLVPLRDRVNIVQAAIKDNFDAMVCRLCDMAPNIEAGEINSTRDELKKLEDKSYLHALGVIESVIERKRLERRNPWAV